MREHASTSTTHPACIGIVQVVPAGAITLISVPVPSVDTWWISYRTADASTLDANLPSGAWLVFSRVASSHARERTGVVSRLRNHTSEVANSQSHKRSRQGRRTKPQAHEASSAQKHMGSSDRVHLPLFCMSCLCTHPHHPHVPGLASKVYVHRFTSPSVGGRLVAVLSPGQTFNDYTADFFVTVGSITADTASLTFNYCNRQPSGVIAVQRPQQLPVSPGTLGFSRVSWTFD